MVKVYLAAALSQAGQMRDIAFRVVTETSATIISTWQDEVQEGAVDPHCQELRNGILYKNLDQLGYADAVIADTRYGVPCATFGEIAYALALHIPIIWIQPASRRSDGVRAANIFDAHDLASVVYSEDEAINALKSQVAGAPCDTKSG